MARRVNQLGFRLGISSFWLSCNTQKSFSWILDYKIFRYVNSFIKFFIPISKKNIKSKKLKVPLILGKCFISKSVKGLNLKFQYYLDFSLPFLKILKFFKNL